MTLKAKWKVDDWQQRLAMTWERVCDEIDDVVTRMSELHEDDKRGMAQLQRELHKLEQELDRTYDEGRG